MLRPRLAGEARRKRMAANALRLRSHEAGRPWPRTPSGGGAWPQCHHNFPTGSYLRRKSDPGRMGGGSGVFNRRGGNGATEIGGGITGGGSGGAAVEPMEEVEDDGTGGTL